MLTVLFATFSNHIIDLSEVVYCSLFWVLFVDFVADFFFGFSWEGGKNRGRVLFGCGPFLKEEKIL